jgi:hypothetical protein
MGETALSPSCASRLEKPSSGAQVEKNGEIPSPHRPHFTIPCPFARAFRAGKDGFILYKSNSSHGRVGAVRARGRLSIRDASENDRSYATLAGNEFSMGTT